MPYKNVSHMSITGEGAVVSLIDKTGETYLAIQNRSCSEAATLDITFNGRVSLLTLNDGVDLLDKVVDRLLPAGCRVYQSEEVEILYCLCSV